MSFNLIAQRAVRFTAGALLAAIVLGLGVSTASAKLVLETRFTGRSGQGDAQVGEVFSYDVYAVVTGTNDILTDEALQSINGRFLSKDVNGGLLRGNLAANPLAPYNDLGSVSGTQRDLDGDGDLDIGGTNPASFDGYFACRVSPIKGIPYATGIPQEFKFANLTFTVTEVLGAQAGADTLIQFEQRDYYSAGIWFVDGQMRTWNIEHGTSGQAQGLAAAAGAILDPEGFFFPPAHLSAVVPEPATLGLLALGAVALLPRRRS